MSEQAPPAKRRKLDSLAHGYTQDVESHIKSSKTCEWNDVMFVVGEEQKIFYGMRGLFAIHSPVFQLRALYD